MPEAVSTNIAIGSVGAAPRPPRWRIGRLNVEVRRDVSLAYQAAMVTGSVLVGVLLSGLVLVLVGVPAGALLDEFIVSTLFDATNLRAVLFQASPLILVGLSASTAFRVRFWNLGIEGQMILGGMGATAVSLAGLGPEWLRLPLMGLAAMAAGIVWALAPVLLRLRLGVNEIISTLLLNYVALDLLLHLLYGSWKDPRDNFPHSPAFAPFELLPTMGGALSSALAIAAVATVALAYLMHRSRAGFYMRFVSANPSVAHALGLPLSRLVLWTVLLSGALSALAGFVNVTGQEGRLTQSFFRGYGVSGVLIGFLARNNPVAAAVVAVLMGVLFVAGQNLQVFYSVPQSMVQLIQALIVICVASSDFLVRHRLHWIR